MIRFQGSGFSDFVLAQANYGNVPGGAFGTAIFIMATLLGLLLLGTKLKQSWFPSPAKVEEVKVGPNPLSIRLEENFPTRREFERLESEVQQIERVQTESERRLLAAIEKSGDKVLKKVDEIGTAGANGRRDLHEKNRLIGERVAKVEAKITKIKS